MATARERLPPVSPAGSGSSSTSLTVVDALLAKMRDRKLTAQECEQLTNALAEVPGRLRTAALGLAAQRDAASVDALLRLPGHAPGVVEGIYKAIECGITRRFDGEHRARPMLALDFRNSRARNFPELLVRASSIFGEDLEALRVAGRLHHRAVLSATPAKRARLRKIGSDLEFLHGRLERLRGTRLWVNGWCFHGDDTLPRGTQPHLLQAWLRWATREEA
jgi:hypothetical protein